MEPGLKRRMLGWAFVPQPRQRAWGHSSPVCRGAYARSNSLSSADDFYLNRKREGYEMCTSTNLLGSVAGKEDSQASKSSVIFALQTI